MQSDAFPSQIQYIHAILRNALSNAEREELITRNVTKLVQTPSVQRVSGRLIIDETKRCLRHRSPSTQDHSRGAAPTPRAPGQGARRRWRVVDRPRPGLHNHHRHTHRTPSLNTHREGIRTQAGLPGVHRHDLRHTVVSLLLELGTPPHVVQAIARHADLDVTMKIYAHTNLDTMRQALDKIDWDAE